MKITKKLLAVNVIFAVVIAVVNLFYQLNGFDFTLKCICSACFALLGLINFWCIIKRDSDGLRFYLFMLVGLILAMSGDVLIGFNFMIGAATFAVGHIFFILAYSTVKRLCKTDLAVGGILFLCAALFLLFFPYLDFGSSVLKAVCLVYAAVISLMLGKAIGNFTAKKDIFNGVIAIASALFFFSDLMLVFNMFTDLWSRAGNACMGAYYPALTLLAMSICLKTCGKD